MEKRAATIYSGVGQTGGGGLRRETGSMKCHLKVTQSMGTVDKTVGDKRE